MTNKRTNNAEEIVEEFSVKSSEAVAFIKELVRKGNIRRITLKTAAGREILTIPVTAAVVGAGAALVLGGWWALVAAAVAYVADVKIEVWRVAEPDDDDAPNNKRKSRVEIE
ncbi:DUF4342 domain-containing protein [Aggregatilineales bacterium SYSU G02658]